MGYSEIYRDKNSANASFHAGGSSGEAPRELFSFSKHEAQPKVKKLAEMRRRFLIFRLQFLIGIARPKIGRFGDAGSAKIRNAIRN